MNIDGKICIILFHLLYKHCKLLIFYDNACLVFGHWRPSNLCALSTSCVWMWLKVCVCMSGHVHDFKIWIHCGLRAFQSFVFVCMCVCCTSKLKTISMIKFHQVSNFKIENNKNYSKYKGKNLKTWSNIFLCFEYL